MDPLTLLEPAATRVRDPLTGRSVWLAGLIQDARIEGDTLRFTLACKKEHGADDRARIREALLRNLAEKWPGEVACTVRVEGVAAASAPAAGGHGHDHAHDHGGAKKGDAVRGMSGPGIQPHGGPIAKAPLPGVKHIVAVASGKGGVGKSTVATNLAVGLAKAGYAVGLLDADIYGPSLPLMMHVTGKPLANAEKKIIPLVAHGVKCMSIGFLVDDKEPIIWRGPMVMGVINQFFKDVDWGDTDYLIIDLPPGTGDAQLTMVQAVPLSGGIIVTTPQQVALLDAVRGLEMFRKLDVPLLGIVENMAYYDVGGARLHPFGENGGKRLAEEYQVDLLGQVPLRDTIRAAGDAGRPSVLDGEPVFAELARRIAERLPA
ncbi:MAG: Mrp/NBP35 family ATP-binding protein [Pseudomonadota bacterium]|nr:Mrp/NBP35 family ATP-binding protein [Pseudomonadota bacterium]